MKYTTPEMELVMFETEEVIVASTVLECPQDTGNDDGWG